MPEPFGPITATTSGKHKTQYDSLDLTYLWSSGMTGHFAGHLAVDGGGSYPFTVDATDGTRNGSPDHVRIRVYAPGADPNAATPMHRFSGDLLRGGVRLN